MRATTETTVATHRSPTWWTVGGVLALVLLAAVPVRAQTRSASVRVNVTVLDFAVSDVIGVHGVATSAPTSAGATAGSRQGGATWRITTGGSSAVGVRLESVAADGTPAGPAVSLCAVPVRAAACRPHAPPATHGTSATASAEWLLRLGQLPDVVDGDDEDRVVRLTIDYVGS